MTATADTAVGPHPLALERTVTELAAIYRPSASPGEREAAEWLALRLRSAHCETRVEEERVSDANWWVLTLLGLTAAAAGRAVARGRRLRGLVLGALAGGGIVDECSNGPRLLRRPFPRRSTWNVIAETGDRGAARTLVVFAHHDAAHTGLLFHPAPQRALADRFPDFVERTDTAVPMWWPSLAAPVLAIAGALLGRRGAGRLSKWLGLATAGAALDVALRPAVPGANDNLSGVAGLVALAEALEREPLAGLRVLLVSCGAEETLQEGIRAFAARHFGDLPRETTWFLNLESVGSPRLALLEGEGPLWMEEYTEAFKDLIADCAEESGIALRRGLRARTSTDGVIPLRAGYPTATLISVDRCKSISNYHWPTDVPENVNYETVAAATRLAEAVLRHLATAATDGPPPREGG